MLVAQISLGQCTIQINGCLRDNVTHLPISYVSVHIDDHDFVRSSDSLGLFSMNGLCKGNYFIRCQRIGFKTLNKQIEVTSDSTYLFEMEFDPSVFRTIEIESLKNTNQPTSITTIIDNENLLMSRGGSLSDALKSATGVNALNTGNNISKPIIHGLHSNRILILNNGIRQEGQQWGSEHAPEIDPFIADKLTVIKGASGLQFGHDAIGGVILVEPKDMRTSIGFNGQVDLVGASNGRQGIASGIIEICPRRFPKFSARIQGTLRKNGNIRSPDYFLKNTSKKEANFSYAAEYRHEKINLSIFYSQFNTDVGIFSGSHIGNLSDLQKAIHAEAPFDTSGFSYAIDRPKQHIEHELFKLKFTWFNSEDSKLSIVYARQYNLREEFDKHRPRNDSLAAINHPELHLEITTHTADLHWEKKQVRSLKLLAGFNTSYQGNTYEGRFFIPNFIQQSGGVYLIEQLNKKQSSFEVGLRYDVRRLQVYRYNLNVLESPLFNYGNFATNLGWRKKLTQHFNMRWNGNTTWRSPQASELFSNGLHHGSASVEIGNANLKVERAVSSSVELTFVHSIFGVTVQPYFNHFDNFIFLAPQLPATLTIRGAFPTFTYQQNEVLMYGLDGEAFVNLNETTKVICKTSIVRAKNKTSNDYLIQIPADKYEFSIKKNIKENGRMSNVGISYIYINKQWRVPTNSDYLQPPDAYYLLQINAQTRIRFSNSSVLLGININNALNRSYRDYMNRFRYFTDEMGRSFSIHLSIPFNKNPSE